MQGKSFTDHFMGTGVSECHPTPSTTSFLALQTATWSAAGAARHVKEHWGFRGWQHLCSAMSDWLASKALPHLAETWRKDDLGTGERLVSSSKHHSTPSPAHREELPATHIQNRAPKQTQNNVSEAQKIFSKCFPPTFLSTPAQAWIFKLAPLPDSQRGLGKLSLSCPPHQSWSNTSVAPELCDKEQSGVKLPHFSHAAGEGAGSQTLTQGLQGQMRRGQCHFLEKYIFIYHLCFA